MNCGHPKEEEEELVMLTVLITLLLLALWGKPELALTHDGQQR